MEYEHGLELAQGFFKFTTDDLFDVGFYPILSSLVNTDGQECSGHCHPLSMILINRMTPVIVLHKEQGCMFAQIFFQHQKYALFRRWSLLFGIAFRTLIGEEVRISYALTGVF